MTIIEKEIAQYPETGIINPSVHIKFYLTQEMIDFFNGYLLIYKDYPDEKIAKEFSEKFEIDINLAKDIEHAYVVVNRARIYKRIEALINAGMAKDGILKQISLDFGIDTANAEKYVLRCLLDGLDNMSGVFVVDNS